MKLQETRLNEISSLIAELSDEEAGACVGGTGYVNPAGNPLGWGTLKKYDGEDRNDPIEDDPNGSVRTRSDRNQKENFATVDVEQVLTKVANLPIETWNYKDQSPTIRHIGPMAQDFAAAFAVGEDNRFINLVDANGVALAAIQGLYKLLQEKDDQIRAMRAELDTFKQQLLITQMEKAVAMPVAAL